MVPCYQRNRSMRRGADCGRDGATAAHHRTSSFECGAMPRSTGGGPRRQLQSVDEERPLPAPLVAPLEGLLRLRP